MSDTRKKYQESYQNFLKLVHELGPFVKIVPLKGILIAFTASWELIQIRSTPECMQ